MTTPAEQGRGRHVEEVDPARWGLRRVAGRPPLRTYLEQVWDRRHFVLADARGRVGSGTRDTRLGTAWLVLRPVLDGMAYFVLFGLLLEVDRGIVNFVGYLLVGVFLFSFTSRCLTQGAQALLSGRNLIRSFSFPRAVLPLAVVVREVLGLVPVLAAMLLLVLALPPAEQITWRWVLLPVLIALQTVFNLGLALLAARATARLPDLNQVIGLLTRFWLYGSAVFFSYDAFVTHPGLLRLLSWNPMFLVLDIARDVLLYGRTPSPASWAQLTLWAGGMLALGTVVFWRGEGNGERA